VVSSNHFAFELDRRRETSHLDLSSEFRKIIVLVFPQEKGS
jgi:hypothetical protein